MTASAISGRHLSKFEETAENAAYDIFGSNFSGAGFLSAPPVGGRLVNENAVAFAFTRRNIMFVLSQQLQN